jgi:hypothetical protein
MEERTIVITHTPNGIGYGGCLLLAATTMTAAAGCAAEVYPEPVTVYSAPVEEEGLIYVEAPPPDIEIYPHVSFGGGDAYFVEGRWYRRGPRGWSYYRDEPPELARQRPDHDRDRPNVQQAPQGEGERHRAGLDYPHPAPPTLDHLSAAPRGPPRAPAPPAPSAAAQGPAGTSHHTAGSAAPAAQGRARASGCTAAAPHPGAAAASREAQRARARRAQPLAPLRSKGGAGATP